MPTPPKHFGRAPAPVVPFTATFVRDGAEEVHEFTARPSVQYADMSGLLDAQGGDELAFVAANIAGGDRIIRRCLVDDDGTPAAWEPVIDDEHFTDPNGDLAPIDLLEKYEAFEAGSSRRRWSVLMRDTDIAFAQFMEIAHWLTEQAADRPTPRSSP